MKKLKEIISQKIKEMIYKAISKIKKNKLENSSLKNSGSESGISKDLSDIRKKAINILFYGGVGFIGWKFGLKPALENYRANKATQKIYNDPNYKYASALQKAIKGGGTDEDTIYETARLIKDWNGVQKAYSQLTKGGNLDEDLKSDLRDNEYYSFMRIVEKSLDMETKQGYIVISKKEIRLRETPDSTPGIFSFNSNILETVEKAKLLGFATGRKKVDDKGVLYFQVRIKYLKTIPEYHQRVYQKQKNRILTFWVGAGAVDMYREFSQMRKVYPTVKIYSGTKDTGLRQILKK